RQCPSVYLHSHCPLCFGGRPPQKQNHDLDCQKGHEREEGMRDPPIFSPRTVQISEANLKEWEANVDAI
ncbi:hypothetical protein BS47DRAFT_1281474, partial [Hydnum rufescens UP504]